MIWLAITDGFNQPTGALTEPQSAIESGNVALCISPLIGSMPKFDSTENLQQENTIA